MLLRHGTKISWWTVADTALATNPQLVAAVEFDPPPPGVNPDKSATH